MQETKLWDGYIECIHKRLLNFYRANIILMTLFVSMNGKRMYE